MYEEGLTARCVARFDDAIFNNLRKEIDQFDFAPTDRPNKYLRPGDGTYLLYLPNNIERILGFFPLTGPIDKNISQMMLVAQSPIYHLMSLLMIEDPILVQADIAHMPPGGDTVMHRDTRISQRYSRRYNIALKTNPDCWLYHHSYDLSNGGVRDHIEPGEIWELNNKITHTAVNYGKTWRTHLIIDVMPRKYWRKMKEIYPDPFVKVPNPQRKNDTFDLDLEGNPIKYPGLFDDLPICFPARTHI